MTAFTPQRRQRPRTHRPWWRVLPLLAAIASVPVLSGCDYDEHERPHEEHEYHEHEEHEHHEFEHEHEHHEGGEIEYHD